MKNARHTGNNNIPNFVAPGIGNSVESKPKKQPRQSENMNATFLLVIFSGSATSSSICHRANDIAAIPIATSGGVPRGARINVKAMVINMRFFQDKSLSIG